MADERKELPRFTSDDGLKLIIKYALEVHAEFAGAWSQQKCAIAIVRALVDVGIEIPDELQGDVNSILYHGCNSSAVKQASVDKIGTAGKPGRLQVDYSKFK